jgi:hypothetical protein
MTVRRKLILAWLLSAIIFVIAMNFLHAFHAHGAFFLLAALIVFSGFYFYANSLRCPHCKAKAFQPTQLATPFVPKRCQNCGLDLGDRPPLNGGG